MDECNKNNLVSKLYRILLSFFMVGYFFIILYVTMLSREQTIHYQVELVPFWSYIEWFARKKTYYAWECIENIMFFVPVGFVLSSVFDARNRKIVAKKIVFAGFLISLVVELGELVTRRGLAEFDDLFNNTLGTFLGVLGWIILKRICKRYGRQRLFPKVTLLFMGICITGGALVCLGIGKEHDPDYYYREFAFQLDSVNRTEDGKLILDGYSFIYGKGIENNNYSIALRDMESGIFSPIETRTGFDRIDIYNFFEEKINNLKCGFQAETDALFPADRVFEVLIQWKGIEPKETGIYLQNDKIFSFNPNNCKIDFTGTDLEHLIDEGYLLVCRPDFGCYVYQQDNLLFYILDENFAFDKDDDTYIQLQKWERRAAHDYFGRLEDDWYFNMNYGFGFEKKEISDTIECGRFRVAVQNLPENRDSTTMNTGQYEDGHWLWRDYFRVRT